MAILLIAMKINRTLTLSKAQVDALDPNNRSRHLSEVVLKTILDPNRLVNALSTRLSAMAPQSHAYTIKTSVTLPDRVSQGLDELVTRSGLPIEHIVRLCIEAEVAVQQEPATSKADTLR